MAAGAGGTAGGAVGAGAGGGARTRDVIRLPGLRGAPTSETSDPVWLACDGVREHRLAVAGEVIPCHLLFWSNHHRATKHGQQSRWYMSKNAHAKSEGVKMRVAIVD